MDNLGKVISIEVIHDFEAGNRPSLNGNNGARLGMMQMMNVICGGSKYDGYCITTESHKFYVLIDNGQSCCEDWGYFSSNDDVNDYVGKMLSEVSLTNTALDRKTLELKGGDYLGEGGIQFVDFKFTDGAVLQLAVYNAHNGYYGHSILIVKDDEILSQDTL